jgi:hypothetical protein
MVSSKVTGSVLDLSTRAEADLILRANGLLLYKLQNRYAAPYAACAESGGAVSVKEAVLILADRNRAWFSPASSAGVPMTTGNTCRDEANTEAEEC